MNLDRIAGQEPSSGWAQQEALDELQWIKGKIPRDMWNVFENVCRFDMPAGTAGSVLANNKRSAIDAARICVSLVANLLATWWRL